MSATGKPVLAGVLTQYGVFFLSLFLAVIRREACVLYYAVARNGRSAVLRENPDDADFFAERARSQFEDLADTFLLRLAPEQWIEIAKRMLKFAEFRRGVYAEIYKQPTAFSDVYEASGNVEFFDPWYLQVLREYPPFWVWADTEVRDKYKPEPPDWD